MNIPAPAYLPNGKPDFSKTWRIHLATIWSAQFMSAIGFAFGLPFITYMLQEEMGITDQVRLTYWVAVFNAACPLTMMLFAPVWGALGDRYGRKKMLLRSYVGGTVAIGLMSVAQTPLTLVMLRIVQGAFCGTVSASQTLLATQTPEEHTGFALGALNSAMFSGTIAGSFAGGYVAETFGYRQAFLISSLLMILSFIAVFFFVREYYDPPKGKRTGLAGILSALKPETSQISYLLPIILIMGFVMFTREYDVAYIPLFVQTLHGGIEGASALTGALSGLCGLAGVVSGFLLGYLADHYPPGRLAVISAMITACFMFSLTFAYGMVSLFILRFIMIFASSGIDPALQIWLARKTNAQTRGQMFGWASSMRCFGLGISPLIGSPIVAHLGVRAIFVSGALLFLIAAILVAQTMRHYREL